MYKKCNQENIELIGFKNVLTHYANLELNTINASNMVRNRKKWEILLNKLQLA